MAAKRRSSEDISRVLADAETLGDDKAAAKHKLSTRQIRRYRIASETCPELSARVHSKRVALSEGWLQEAKKARMEALEIGLNLARESDNLRDVTGFLKIVHDAVLADEMLNPPEVKPDELNRRGDVLASQESSGRQVHGSASTH